MKYPRHKQSGGAQGGGKVMSRREVVSRRPVVNRCTAGLGLLVSSLLAPSVAQAHHPIELTAQAGYSLGTGTDVTIDGAEGHVSLDGSWVLGAALGYRVERDGFIYLSYSRQPTALHYTPLRSVNSTATRELDIDVLQFGGYTEITRGRWVPYLGFGVGASRLAARDAIKDEWRLTSVVDGGVKLELFEHLFLRASGRVPITFFTSDSRVFCLEPYGCTAQTSSPLLQIQFLLGLSANF